LTRSAEITDRRIVDDALSLPLATVSVMLCDAGLNGGRQRPG
jgi:hypothetical protein